MAEQVLRAGKPVLRMGTRGSLLARAQSEMIAATLEKSHTGLRIDRRIYKTTGDKILDRPLHEFGGKGLFTKEIEEDLLAGSIDFIVHSCKDVPVTMPLVDQRNLAIAAAPLREDPRDALVSPIARTIADLPKGAKVGTGSLRRRCQLLALRPDLKIELLRGNVDTRVKKSQDGSFDAVILAMAGLIRSGLFDESIMSPIPPGQMLPAAGQGALMIQSRTDDATTRKLLQVLDDPATAEAIRLERTLVAELNGDCHSPIAVLAELTDGQTHLRAAIGAKGGNLPIVRAEAFGKGDEALASVMASLTQQNVMQLLHE